MSRDTLTIICGIIAAWASGSLFMSGMLTKDFMPVVASCCIIVGPIVFIIGTIKKKN